MSSSFSVEAPTTWKYGRSAAYSIIHDDLCSYDSHIEVADPQLNSRGLVAGFGAFVELCEDEDYYGKLATLRAHGHEVINHSWTHSNLTTFSDNGREVDLNLEITQAKSTLDAKVDDQQTTFYIFPFDAFRVDDGGYSGEYDSALFETLTQSGHLGARAGERGINAANFPNPMRLNFDVYGPSYSIYAGSGACPLDPETETPPETDECRLYVLNQLVDEAVSQGGFAIREFHGVQDDSWEAVPESVYASHLEHVKQAVDQGQLWMATPSTVVRYRMARDACGAPSVSGQTLSFSGSTSADCIKYATELTVHVNAKTDLGSLTATQAGTALEVEMLDARRFMLQVDPTKGDVSLQGG